MSCNVLIVDDSAILRRAIRKVVVLAGISEERIHEACHGEDALRVLENEWVDLVLLDLNMPVMDGEKFASELRKRDGFADIPIVVVSTEVNRERLQRMAALGVVESLRKPFEPEELKKLVRRVVGARI